MDKYTLENFIDFCDDYELAEESFREVKKYDKIIKKKIDLLKIKLKNNDGDYEEQAKLIDDIVKDIDEYIKTIEGIEITKGDGVIAVLKKIGGVVTAILSALAIVTIVGMPLAFPGVGATIKLFDESDPSRYKATVISKLRDAKSYLLKVKKYLKENSVATEAVGSIKEEKAKLKQDMQNSGYGSGSKGRFKKDIGRASRYLDNQSTQYIKNKYSSEIALMKKIAKDIDKEFVYIAHKHEDAIGQVSITIYDKNIDSINVFIEGINYDDSFDSTGHAIKNRRKEISSCIREFNEAAHEIKRKYKSSLGEHLKITFSDEEDDVDFVFTVELKDID